MTQNLISRLRGWWSWGRGRGSHAAVTPHPRFTPIWGLSRHLGWEGEGPPHVPAPGPSGHTGVPTHALPATRAPAPPHCHHPAAPRSCIIDKDELKDGLRVLIPMDDKLLYAGHVQTVHSPDM